VGGIDLLGRCSPWKVPLAPLTIRSSRCLRCPLGSGMTGKGDLGNAPLRRTPTLTHTHRQATTKRRFERFEMQFSAGCCRNNTSFESAINRRRRPRWPFPRPSHQPCKGLKVPEKSVRTRLPLPLANLPKRAAVASSSANSLTRARTRKRASNTSHWGFCGDDSFAKRARN
jgi:hypothetical protein